MLRSVKARDYMAEKLVTFRPETDLFTAISSLKEYHLSATPVVDENGALVGMLSEVDCLRAILSQTYYEDEKGSGGHVKDYMTCEVDSVPQDADIIAVAKEFIAKGRRSLPVVKDGKLVGLITRRDILAAVEDFARDG